jgi:RNA polymerase sigma-70 factor (ECF subfamily)
MTGPWTDAYRTYFPLLVRKCARMLGDGAEAEDIAQETFIRFARSGLESTDVKTVTAWLYRTSTRLALDRLRARRRLTSDTALASLFAADAPEATVELRALLAELAWCAPTAELEAALLQRVDGLSQRELAEVLGVHERTVRRLIARFEARLQRMQERSDV